MVLYEAFFRWNPERWVGQVVHRGKRSSQVCQKTRALVQRSTKRKYMIKMHIMRKKYAELGQKVGQKLNKDRQ
jgi:hypothetical protein